MTKLLKVHGSQNQFFILDQTVLKQPLSDAELKALTIKLTDPETGLLGGADGVLAISQSDHPGVLGKMRVINADGSEASMCGNGLRTVARYLSEKTGQDQFKVETMYTDLKVRRQPDFAPGVPAMAVEISPVKFAKEDLPFDNLGHERLLDTLVPEFVPGWKFSALAVPNPHLVTFIKQAELTSPVLGELGTYLNGTNPYFSDGVNVNYVVIRGENELFVRTFERGVGFTNACGTGMSASSLVFALTHPDLGHFNQPITVFNPGGMVKTILHNEDHKYWIELIGNATETHEVEIAEADLHHARVDQNAAKITETSEQAAYMSFVDQLPAIR